MSDDNIVNFTNHKNVNDAIKNTTCIGVDNYDEVLFPVDSRPIFVEGKVISTHKAIYRPDIEKTIAIVGIDYKILENARIFKTFEDSLRSSELDTTGMERIVELAKNGQKTYVRYRLPAHSVNVGNRTDNTILEFCAINSYDGSTSFTAFMGGYRLICSNGQVLGDDLSFLRGRHTKNLEIEKTADKFRIAAEKFVFMGDKWNQWATTKITVVEAYLILTTSGINHSLANKIIEQFQHEANKLDYTLWALYNSLTHISTHTQPNKGSEDNAPAITQRREKEVSKIINSTEWLKVA